MVESWVCLFEGAYGLKTLTSKNALSNLLPQKPSAAISNLAPSCLLADAPDSASPVMGCRCGSMATLWQTSAMRLAVKSLVSLCRIDGKPPFAHDNACSTEKLVPQEHVVGMLLGLSLIHI